MSDVNFALGFIAGEGTFAMTMNKADGNYYPRLRFGLRVHKKDEQVLRECKEAFDNLGNISKVEGRTTIDWTVTAKSELENLRNKIESECPEIWLKSDKYRNFSVWSEMLDIHLDGKTGPEDTIEMIKLAKNGLNTDNGITEEEWDRYIEDFRNRMNKEKFICGSEKSSSDGICQREVTEEDETCWDH